MGLGQGGQHQGTRAAPKTVRRMSGKARDEGMVDREATRMLAVCWTGFMDARMQCDFNDGTATPEV